MRGRGVSVSGAVVFAAAALMAVPGGSAVAATGCVATAGFDANNDGVDDTAFGSPLEDTLVPDAGVVTIVYGSAANRTFGGGSLLITQETAANQKSEAGDHFGAALAIGDLNADGCKDLVIGVPGENSNAGRVVIVYGSPTGLRLSSAHSISQDTPGVGSSAEANDQFGAALAIQGTGPVSLWVGSPGEDYGKIKGAGMVFRFPGTTGGGRIPTISPGFLQGVSGVPGTAQAGDRFGEVMSGSPYSVLIGVPKQNIGTAVNAGQVYAYRTGWSTFSQASAQLAPSVSEAGDKFGAQVAQVPSCSGGPTDEAYVVGAPRKNVGGIADAGTVSVIDVPADSGLVLQQGDALVGGTLEAGDTFGARVVAAGHLLVAAAPLENIGSLVHGGVVYQGFMGCNGSVPTVTSHVTTWLGNGAPGTALSGDRFGQELGFAWIHEGDLQGPSLLVGAPHKADGSILDGGRAYSFGTKSGDLFTDTNATTFAQSDAAISSTAEQSDEFGAVIGSNSN